jgi:quinol monooxygenase YgiN
MAEDALFIQHRTKPGKRDDVEAIWRKHIKPTVAVNDDVVDFYGFGEDPESICAFQKYPDREATTAFVKTPQYAGYYEEVSPLLLGEPIIAALDVQWSKWGDRR